MKIGITGTPGVGKTAIAKMLGEFIKIQPLNEKEFALKEGIGEFDKEENELVVPLKKLEESLNKYLKKQKNAIIEGHLICEIKADFDYIIVITCDPEILEARLEMRGYKAEKVQDNVFCEGIEYCRKHAARKYPKKKRIEVESRKSIKETFEAIIIELNKRENK
ncbi:MAG: hypothetical protein COV47_02380 [Candidatus Diapherotrites archaeon CG11_big_fil_rev_8_21_14_0_20_37_9]|nr:MAG: hypothetical protein COV47_02380 [Candidatus Diapherotrites archaeon CG11_big_fil_rev_8_21_14_0_20_37_9]